MAVHRDDASGAWVTLVGVIIGRQVIIITIRNILNMCYLECFKSDNIVLIG